MSKHKFTTGDRVVVSTDALNKNISPGVYTIVKVLPLAGQGFQYRAKNANDTHERVLDEAQLRAAYA